MKIAIANDMRLAAEALRRVVASTGEHQVIWTAHDGEAAIRQCAHQRPDLLLMDLVMPVVDGVEATRIIMQRTPCAILVVTATPDDNPNQVFRAMGAGALDVTATPVLTGQLDDGAGLLVKIRTIGKLIQADLSKGRRRDADAAGAAETACGPITQLIAIGASTGGPLALARVLTGLLLPPTAAIVIVQHIDECFTDTFAIWLSAQTGSTVRTVDNGMLLESPGIYIAKTNDHLLLDRTCHLRYSAKPLEYPYRPSVNVFFQSVAQHWPGEAIGVLLTGMGRDGADGLLAMKQAGKLTIAQDHDSAVYGMPRAAAEIDAASLILPVERIGAALQGRLSSTAESVKYLSLP